MRQGALKCLVVDDEPIARAIIETYIERIPNLMLVSSQDNVFGAIEYLAANNVDIIFSDIEMPSMNGLQFVRNLSSRSAVIFTTAHREFAVESYSIGVVDYLVKPIDFERFILAVSRAQEFLERGGLEIKFKDYIFVKAEGKLMKLVFKDILYVEAMKDYLFITTLKDTIKTLMTLKSIEALLDPNIFFRVHRSFIINISYIQSFNGNVVILNGDKKLPITSQRKSELFTFLNIV